MAPNERLTGAERKARQRQRVERMVSHNAWAGIVIIG